MLAPDTSSQFSAIPCGRIALCWVLLAIASNVQAQTQASCTFNLFPLPSQPAYTSLIGGVNDWGTVVGSANGRAFIRYAGGGISYYLLSGALTGAFFARNNIGVTTGEYVDASNNENAFMLIGSTLTLIEDPKAVAHNTRVHGINRWNSDCWELCGYPHQPHFPWL